jgi:hypothetical protein
LAPLREEREVSPFHTVNDGHLLSEHTHPLRSVHANRASGATS